MDPGFEARKRDAKQQLCRRRGEPVRLRKTTTNLFRARPRTGAQRLDLGAFNQILTIDAGQLSVEVEGLATYEDLVDATLPHGLMPQVVPQLKTITIGGAVAGGGIESSSFRYGFVHETIDEIEILLADGSTVVATPQNEHRDLFFGFPNSYGTLGYALRIRARLAPVKPYVHLTHQHFRDADTYFTAVTRECAGPMDFIDGVVFGTHDLVLTTGSMVDHAPRVSDYTWMKIYYRSLLERPTDDLTVRDYLWRWDADWFWCSRAFGMQRRVPRFLVGKFMLQSRRYRQLLALEQRFRVQERLGRGQAREAVIQDVQIPVQHAAHFLGFLLEEIPIRPIWICPARSPDGRSLFPLYPTDPSTLYVNFGFWGTVPSTHPAGTVNRRVEAMVERLEGKKSLYSTAYYSEDTFARLYNRDAYARLKRRYDPDGALGTMYDKCVRPR